MSDKPMLISQPQRAVSLDRRIAELQARAPMDINHGEALLLQNLAAASLREQRLTDESIALDDLR